MKYLNFIKGIFVGIAKIIPGLSGSLLMISFGLYDKAIYAIIHFFDDVKNNFFFLFEFGLGVLFGIVLFSHVIIICLKYYYLYTIMFFIGLILGGVPCLIKNISLNKNNLLYVFFSFFLVTFFSSFYSNYSYSVKGSVVDFFVFCFSGFLEAIGTVVPGVSSTALLMLVGVYSYYITSISHLFYISLFWENMMFFVPFSLGLAIGIVVVSFVIDYMFQRFRESTYSVILGCVFSSVILLLFKVFPFFTGMLSFVISFILICIGYVVVRFF